jgi:transposase InsO family protein
MIGGRPRGRAFGLAPGAAASGASVTMGVGTRLIWGGELCSVVGLDAGGVLLRGSRGSSVRVATTILLADPGARILATRMDGVEDAGSDIAGDAHALPAAIGPLLEDLHAAEHRQLEERLAHVRELLSGYASGCADQARAGEPRAGFEPHLPLKDRYAAKAAEIGVGVRTLERWVGAFRESGTVGLLDGRWLRSADVLAGVDERWLTMCRTVLGEHTEASRPTKALVLARIAARLDQQHGPGHVPVPGEKKARRVLDEVTRGSNAFNGSTKGKRSIAGRPEGVYGRLRATRPGEYLLLDTTPLDVFAMEALTLRWVRVELTIAMDLFSRSIVGLRLSPVSTKSVDAAIVLFETLHPATRRSTGAGVLPYAGLPDLVVVQAQNARFAAAFTSAAPQPVAAEHASGLPGVAAETIVVDHGKIYLSRHLMSVCERLGISVQPARPLTPTDKEWVAYCTSSGRYAGMWCSCRSSAGESASAVRGGWVGSGWLVEDLVFVVIALTTDNSGVVPVLDGRGGHSEEGGHLGEREESLVA